MKKLISYVFPIYNEQDNIALLYKTMDALLQDHPKYDYELIFVNDGSRDDSLDQLVALQKQDERIIVVDFARNYGHQRAMR